MPVSNYQRDIGLERDYTRQAAGTLGQDVNVRELNAFATDRAGTGPVRERTPREFIVEVLEELADARNYLCWALKQSFDIHTAGADLYRERLMGALAAVVLAYHHVTEAREILTFDPPITARMNGRHP